MTELTELYAISRKTGYKWAKRFELYGLPGLADRSRRPKRASQATPPEIVELILEARRRHPSWGARKLIALILRGHPQLH